MSENDQILHTLEKLNDGTLIPMNNVFETCIFETRDTELGYVYLYKFVKFEKFFNVWICTKY